MPKLQLSLVPQFVELSLRRSISQAWTPDKHSPAQALPCTAAACAGLRVRPSKHDESGGRFEPRIGSYPARGLR